MKTTYYAWCDCGDALEHCNERGSEGEYQYTQKKIRTPKEKTMFCFGCDKFFVLKEVKQKQKKVE